MKWKKHQDCTQKLATKAHIASPIYQVLIHAMPLSLKHENPEHIAALQGSNETYIEGVKIQKAMWLK